MLGAAMLLRAQQLSGWLPLVARPGLQAVAALTRWLMGAPAGARIGLRTFLDFHVSRGLHGPFSAQLHLRAITLRLCMSWKASMGQG